MSSTAEQLYGDIINLPHHVSANHPQMLLQDRAAQFSPFAALTGHEAAINEAARLTENRLELNEDRREILNRQLQLIKEHLNENPSVTFSYFKPDSRKSGGSYTTISGTIKKIDEYESRIILDDDTVIYIDEIIALESSLFYSVYD